MPNFFRNPAYSEVRLESPPPSEIFVPDSDAEEESTTRAAKRRRIEENANSYLKGKAVFIASALLKGPFDERWKNPWQKPRRSNTAGKLEGANGNTHHAPLISAAEQKAQAERKERKRLLKEQRAQRAADLQQDGCGKSTSHPVDLTSKDGLHAVAASDSRDVSAVPPPTVKISAHTRGWLRRQRPPSSTPELQHDKDSSEETPSKPPRTPSSRPSSSHSIPRQPLRTAGTVARSALSLLPRAASNQPAALQTTDVTTISRSSRSRDWPTDGPSPDHNLVGRSARCVSFPGTGPSQLPITDSLRVNVSGSAPPHNQSIGQLQPQQELIASGRDHEESLEESHHSADAEAAPVGLDEGLPGHTGSIVERTKNNREADAALQHESDIIAAIQQSTFEGRLIAQRAPTYDPHGSPHQRSRTPSEPSVRHHSGFTPINRRFASPLPEVPVTVRNVGQEATEPPDDASVTEAARYEDGTSGQQADFTSLEGLHSAKLLSQLAVEQALFLEASSSPASVMPSSADAALMTGLMAAKRLSLDAITREVHSGAPSSGDGVSFRQALRESAERCVTPRGATTTGKAVRKRKAANMKKSSDTAEIHPHLQGPVVDNEAAKAPLPPRRYLLNASPTATNSPGFAYQKVANGVATGASSVTLDADQTSLKKSIKPQRRKPRTMTFASSPAERPQSKPSVEQSERSSNHQLEKTSEETGPSTSDSNAPGLQPPPNSHVTIPDHQDSTAYSLSNRDLSTQAAVLLAQEAFQEELVSPTKGAPEANPEFAPEPDQTLLSPTKAPQINAITPFRAFNSPVRQSPMRNTTRAPMATQDLFNAASPFAVSTVKKPRQGKRASFAALDPEEHVNAVSSPSRALEREAVETSFWMAQPADSAQPPTPAPAVMIAITPAAPSPTDEASVTMSLLPPEDPPAPISSLSPTKSSASRPVPQAMASFSPTPYGSLNEVSFQGGQKLLDDSQFDVDAALDDAESFLQSWDLESETRKSSSKSVNLASGMQSRRKLRSRSSRHYQRYGALLESAPDQIEALLWNCILPDVLRHIEREDFHPRNAIPHSSRSGPYPTTYHGRSIYLHTIYAPDGHIRLYIGQAYNHPFRIAQHLDFRYRRTHRSLHHYALELSALDAFTLLAR
ncbi:hypothetical protein H2201_001300 [Coniosporium apollinis]|uniref:GIY-YIG domain-containing protein n=1 Tax=Coniosporium apollinis TaxID=61459 RepID=A0ABQ9P3L6_9PEZI|nr:hypothetical protein H2201_001300 [Coniosporium apollinis]